jgi:hypothetical protein
MNDDEEYEDLDLTVREESVEEVEPEDLKDLTITPPIGERQYKPPPSKVIKEDSLSARHGDVLPPKVTKLGSVEDKIAVVLDKNTILFVQEKHKDQIKDIENRYLDHMYGNKRRSSEPSIKVIDDTQGTGDTSS